MAGWSIMDRVVAHCSHELLRSSLQKKASAVVAAALVTPAQPQAAARRRLRLRGAAKADFAWRGDRRTARATGRVRGPAAAVLQRHRRSAATGVGACAAWRRFPAGREVRRESPLAPSGAGLAAGWSRRGDTCE